MSNKKRNKIVTLVNYCTKPPVLSSDCLQTLVHVDRGNEQDLA